MSVATGWDDRVAARGRARRRTRLAVALSVLVTVALLVATGWVLLGSGLLGVRTVQVGGTARLDPAEVRAVADVATGTPLALVDTDAVAARVARLPVVRSVDVTRDWPRTVVIRVSERTAAAARPIGPSYALIDRTGVAFATVARRPKDLPIVTAPADAGRPELRVALDVLEQLPADLRQKVRTVRAAGRDEVELHLTRDRTVVWGSAERSERKAAVLAVLLSRKKSKVQTYDVSAPDAPTTRR